MPWTPTAYDPTDFRQTALKHRPRPLRESPRCWRSWPRRASMTLIDQNAARLDRQKTRWIGRDVEAVLFSTNMRAIVGPETSHGQD